MTKQAYNADTLEAAEKAKAKNSTSYQHIDHDAHINKHHINDFIPRAGEQMTTPEQRRQVAPINLIQAAKQIRGEIGDLWTADHYKALQQSFPTGEIPQEAIPDIIEGIKAQSEKPKLRVVGE